MSEISNEHSNMTEPKAQPTSPDSVTPLQPSRTTPEVPSVIPKANPEGRNKKILLLIPVLVLLAVILLFMTFYRGRDSKSSLIQESPQNDTSLYHEVSHSTKLEDRIKDYTKGLEREFTDYSTEIYEGDKRRGVEVFSDAINRFVNTSSQDGWSGFVSRMADSETESTGPYDYLVQRFHDDGWNRYTGKLYNNEWYDAPPTQFQQDDIVCKIQIFSTDRVFFGCANLGNLPEAIADIKPFHDAYDSHYGTPDDPHTVILNIGLITVTDRYPEYETARGSVSNNGYGSAITFYRKNQGTWQFSHRGQDSPDCNSFSSSVDMQKASYSTSCYLSKGSTDVTTVGEYFNL